MQLSIVVPVYRSAECLSELARRVEQEVSGRFEGFELILVNDGSPDDSWKVIEELTREHAFVLGVDLRMNVGQDNAIMAGLRHASGDYVAIMDDDLQHDPADLPRLRDAMEKGNDVVYAYFEKKKQALWKNLGSWLNDRAAVLLLNKPPHIYLSPYKLIRREVIEEVLRYEGPFPYVDGLLFTVTSKITQIQATHHERFAGQGNYNLVRSLRVWLKLVTSFSVLPLRIASFTGGVIAIVSFVLGLTFLVQALVNEEPPGWASLIVSMFFLGGIQLIGIGAVGEYIGRMYITVNNRPQFAVREVLSSSVENDASDHSSVSGGGKGHLEEPRKAGSAG